MKPLHPILACAALTVGAMAAWSAVDAPSPLARRLAAFAPSVPDPAEHARLATAASGADLPPELVLAIAWHESGLTEGRGGEPWHCGVMQVIPPAGGCVAMRAFPVGYSAGTAAMRNWRRLGGSWHRALSGYRCGGVGWRAGDCPVDLGRGYAAMVLRTAGRLGP
jgi:soluble lytic murein transglycosylase-like protein